MYKWSVGVIGCARSKGVYSMRVKAVGVWVGSVSVCECVCVCVCGVCMCMCEVYVQCAR